MICRQFTFAILTIGLAAAATGCSVLAPQPDTSRFFVLTAAAESSQSPAAASNRLRPLALGLGPISFPAYLDRRPMVTRIAPNQLKISDTNFWAAPPKEMVTRVLAQNLVTRLGASQVLPYPWYRTSQLDYAIAVDLDRFESDGTNALLVARWTISKPPDSRALYTGAATITRPAASTDPQAVAAALSQALDSLSQQIAASIRKLAIGAGDNHPVM